VNANDFRPGNRFLEYIVANHARTPEIDRAVAALPVASRLLWEKAVELIRESFLIWNAGVEDAGKQAMLTVSLFDFFLIEFFNEMKLLVGAHDAASLLTDAALFQGMGLEPQVPDEEALRKGTTSDFRGLPKYAAFASSHPHIKDKSAWLFSKEASVVLTGDADIGVMMMMMGAPVLLYRFYARGITRAVLYGEPRDHAKEQLLVDDMLERIAAHAERFMSGDH